MVLTTELVPDLGRQSFTLQLISFWFILACDDGRLIDDEGHDYVEEQSI